MAVVGLLAGWVMAGGLASAGGAAEAMPRLAGDLARVFTESRDNPIRPALGMREAWEAQSARLHPEFEGRARPGEFFVFQVGLQAREALGPLRMEFGALAGARDSIGAARLRCLSLGGTNFEGRAFTKDLAVPTGALQALWVGVDVPVSAQGTYSGAALLRLTPSVSLPVSIRLTVEGEPVLDGGDSAARNLSRLRWLDSTAGSEPRLTAPFTPLQAGGRTVRVLGREMVLGEAGLPRRLTSYFSPSNTRLVRDGRELLAGPMEFVVRTPAGKVKWDHDFGRLEGGELEARWSAASQGDGLRLETAGRVDYTGSGHVAIRLIAGRAVDLADARLETPFREDVARYFMGLNHPGGRRPAEVRWRWDTTRQQDCFWLGDLNAGLLLRFKDAAYVRPLVNIYYGFRPLRLPDSWGNGGRGGIEIAPAGRGRVGAAAASGPRALRAGEALDFVFDFHLTPFRTLDTEKQWSVRFHHPAPKNVPAPLDAAVEASHPGRGPNNITVHQANFYNPYINYPYSDDSFEAFRGLVRRAHARGTGARVYYTTREITHNMPELFALHSLNGEVVFPGPGAGTRTLIHPRGPHPWLVENLGRDFIPAWVAEVGGAYAPLDLSVITTPDSRWNNFYLEGLRWMVRESDLDGVYVDDTALDAGSLRRARRILDTRPGRYIDLHTWNHFNAHAGFASNLALYMELLPYLDRLWLGEGFNANKAAPDYWLVEMSGLPFGVMSEMLDGANPWRGLVFGETARLGWSGDPRPLWQMWDEYGLQGTEFLPFCAANCPVRTSHPEILATAYRRPGRTFVALASWAPAEARVTLTLDWKSLGLNPARAAFFAPAINDLQTEARWKPGEAIPVASGRGWFLVLDETAR